MGESNAAERNFEENTHKAMYHFEQASELYESEEQKSTSNTCKLKVADLAANCELWQKAVEKFEEVAESSLDNNLLKAGLCQMMLTDLVGMNNALDKYQDLDPSFTGTRECKLLQDLTRAAEEADVNEFTRVVAEFDSISRLDQWKTSILCKIKRMVSSKEAADDEDLT